jgi:Protein of unknown function (DUF4089)
MGANPPITEADVERLAASVGLTLDLARRAAVAQQLAGLLVAARLFADFPLDTRVEPAPEFHP